MVAGEPPRGPASAHDTSAARMIADQGEEGRLPRAPRAGQHRRTRHPAAGGVHDRRRRRRPTCAWSCWRASSISPPPRSCARASTRRRRPGARARSCQDLVHRLGRRSKSSCARVPSSPPATRASCSPGCRWPAPAARPHADVRAVRGRAGRRDGPQAAELSFRPVGSASCRLCRPGAQPLEARVEHVVARRRRQHRGHVRPVSGACRRNATSASRSTRRAARAREQLADGKRGGGPSDGAGCRSRPRGMPEPGLGLLVHDQLRSAKVAAARIGTFAGPVAAGASRTRHRPGARRTARSARRSRSSRWASA